MKLAGALCALLFFSAFSGTALAQEAHLDLAPIEPNNAASLQSGARTFVNYCLNCHSAGLVRYNALEQLGLTEEEIKENLMFSADKVGEMMRVTASPADQKNWFGVTPPDLSLEARVRGVDWIYTYLRSFYRDPAAVTGWNNKVYPNVAMPNVLWTLQGIREGKQETVKDDEGEEHKEIVLQPPQGGQMGAAEYDRTVADLVNFMNWMAEPHALERRNLGYLVLIALAVLVLLTYMLKAAFWVDVH